jgi:hypothetical protein
LWANFQHIYEYSADYYLDLRLSPSVRVRPWCEAICPIQPISNWIDTPPNILFSPRLHAGVEYHSETIWGVYPSLDSNEAESASRLERGSIDARGPFSPSQLSRLLARQ